MRALTGVGIETLDAMLFPHMGEGGAGYYALDEELSPLLLERGWDGMFPSSMFFHAGPGGETMC